MTSIFFIIFAPKFPQNRYCMGGYAPHALIFYLYIELGKGNTLLADGGPAGNPRGPQAGEGGGKAYAVRVYVLE